MKTTFLTVPLLLLSLFVRAQQPDSLIQKLDSLKQQTDSAGGQNNIINRKAYNKRTEITFKSYFILTGSDFKQQLTAPFHLSGRDWGNVGKFALLAAGLSFADKPVQRFGNDLRNRHKAVRDVSRTVTNLGAQYEGITLLALGTYGFVFKSEKIQTTALLATQAYITSAVVHSLIKTVAGRQRPNYIPVAGVEPAPAFHGPFHQRFRDESGNTYSSSFPSGHTTLAFAAATVYAMEYKDRPVVPVVAYTAASLIGLSRITENKHWATDVFTGAALGFLTGRQVVNNYHRYAKLKRNAKPQKPVSVTIRSVNGVLVPGFVYTFR